MKKIGILTINDYQNYGNRLQNYATQEVLKSLGFAIETVINNTTYPDRSSTSTKILGKINNLKKMTIKEIYEKITLKFSNQVSKGKIEQYSAKKLEAFKNFTSVNILETDYKITDNDIPKGLSDKFDYFVTGSDQVWNPIYRHGSPLDFLTFAQKNKRIAYSPSFGISEIPSEYVENYKTWLSEMSRLSVREEAGAKIIKDLTGREAVVLIDPTLMLTKKKWLSVSKKSPHKPTKKYLLTYFLGSIAQENKRRIRKIAQENDLQIVNLADIKDKEAYTAGPSEFIDYINSASVLCTDSFHGVIFSIVLKTPFIVFDRIGNLPSMNSRINTILKTVQLNSRLLENVNTNKQVFEANYSHIAPIVEIERKRALAYLKEALQANKSEILLKGDK